MIPPRDVLCASLLSKTFLLVFVRSIFAEISTIDVSVVHFRGEICVFVRRYRGGGAKTVHTGITPTISLRFS
jgi:hypothetical protein